MTSTIGKPELDKMVATFERMGATANKIADAADRITAALPTEAEAKEARRNLRIVAAASWADLLHRLFRRG